MKCTKCKIYHKNKMAEFPLLGLCFTCEIIWRQIGFFLQGLGSSYKINRNITISLDDIVIEKIDQKKFK